MRAHNVGVVLHHIWSSDRTSRAAISRSTGLSRTTVSDIVNELLMQRLVVETGAGESRGGRKPILLELIANARHMIGIEVGSSHVNVVIMDLRGDVQASAGERHSVTTDPTGTVDLVARLTARVVAEADATHSSIMGVGIGVASPLRGPRLRHVSSMILPGWDGIDVAEVFGQRLELPVLIDNDANLGALTEHWWGAGRGIDNLTYIKLGVGVGAGHLIRGDIYGGHGGAAGELGHITVDYSGAICRCGLRGCLESAIGSQVLVEQYRKATPGVDATTIESLVAAAVAGDRNAVEVIQQAGRRLGTAVAHVITMLNPARVIISGPLTDAADIFLGPVRRVAKDHAFAVSMAEVDIVVSQFHHLTVAMGGATRVLQAALRQGIDDWVTPASTLFGEHGLTVTSGILPVQPVG